MVNVKNPEGGFLFSLLFIYLLSQRNVRLCSQFVEEGNGNPLQCSCLENPRDKGAWWAAIYGVAQSQTQLVQLISSCSSQFVSIHHQLLSSCIFPVLPQISLLLLAEKRLGNQAAACLSGSGDKPHSYFFQLRISLTILLLYFKLSHSLGPWYICL